MYKSNHPCPRFMNHMLKRLNHHKLKWDLMMRTYSKLAECTPIHGNADAVLGLPTMYIPQIQCNQLLALKLQTILSVQSGVNIAV